MICDEVLCRQFEATDGRRVVPRQTQEEVLADFHEGLLSAWSFKS